MSTTEKKISVAQIGPVPPPNGGVSSNMMAIHSALESAGHTSVLIDVTNKSGKPAQAKVLKPRSATDLIKMLARSDADIVHYHIGGDFRPKLAALTLVCGMLPRKRSVVTFHSGGWTREMIGSASRYSLRGAAFRSVDLVIGVNRQMMELFAAYGVLPDRTKLVPPFDLRHPSDSAKIPADILAFISEARPLLLSVGGLEPEYQHDRLILAFADIRERFPNARLIIAGVGSLERDLVRLADRLGNSGEVVFAGDLDHEILLRLMKASDVMLRLTRHDGDAISVREAQYVGTPVVATDTGMRPEGVELIAVEFDGAEISGAIANAMRAPKDHSAAGRDEGRNSEKIVELYQQLVCG